jgi:hypothetical protein
MPKSFILILSMLVCLPSAFARDIGIHSVCYGVSKVTLFDEHDKKIAFSDKTTILQTLQRHADFLIEGRLAGNDYAAARILPTIFYLNGFYNVPYICNHSTHRNYPVCKTFNANPEWKMKANGNQLYRWAYECFEVMNVAHPDFQKFMGAHVKNVLQREPFFQGIFLDDVSGHFNAGLYGFHKTNEQAVVQSGKEGMLFIKVKHTINQSQGPCSAIEVKKSNGTQVQVYGVWHAVKTIFLKPEVQPGDVVTVTYYSDAPDWQLPSDQQWTEATAHLLAHIKHHIGSKLLIYNGTQLGYTYDQQFLAYADGCMREGFVADNPTIENWRADIERLASISQRKKYFTLTYIPKNTPPEDEIRQIWFAYASFLLGNNGNGFFSVCYSAQHLIFHSLWNRDIGKPLENFREKANGVYIREYQHAYVAVNPGNKAATVAIPPGFEAHIKAQNQSLLLKPHQGLVLYRAH